MENIKEICNDYLDNKYGMEELSKKYHIGKKKIRKILLDNNIPIKSKGGQKEDCTFIINTNEEKYPKLDNKKYIVYDENTDFQTNDIDNSSGILTSYIHKQYNIQIPSLYYRKKYYKQTGMLWWEQWLKVKIEDNNNIKCPYCEWYTNDINNNSGALKKHLEKEHNIDILTFLKEYPDFKEFFKTKDNTKILQFETNTNNYVICKICGKKLTQITNRHLCKHGITKEQYIEKYQTNNLFCKRLHNIYSSKAIIHNMNSNFVKTSKGEIEILNYIKELGFSCKSNRTILNGKEIDMFIPSLKIGFEYNGLLWHTEKYGKDKNYHIDKLNQCLAKGIKLYQIYEDEYELHKNIVLEKIKHILKKDNKTKINGRKCVIKIIKKEEAKHFLDKYHLQGFVNSNVYLGCFYKDIIVGVMTFKKINQEWELTRFATDYNYNCRGVGGKLFSYFKNNYNFTIIKSFADRRWTVDFNNLYTNLGFKLDKILKPDYYYYNSKVNRYKRFHKFLFRKKILVRKYNLDEKLTESEMVKILGYEKIWNCGLLKYVYKK